MVIRAVIGFMLIIFQDFKVTYLFEFNYRQSQSIYLATLNMVILVY